MMMMPEDDDKVVEYDGRGSSGDGDQGDDVTEDVVEGECEDDCVSRLTDLVVCLYVIVKHHSS